MPPKPAEVNVAYGDEAKNKPKCWFCRNRDHVYQYFRNLLSAGWSSMVGRAVLGNHHRVKTSLTSEVP